MIILLYSNNVAVDTTFKEEEHMARGITNRIKELLSANNMSQKELARNAGITESAISHYIKGDRVPRGVNLMKIAGALGTTTDYLLEYNEINDEESELKVIKTLIARNASNMTKDEKMEVISILFSGE